MKTGTSAMRSTASATDPKSRRLSPVRPWVVIAITSALISLAAAMISWGASPERTQVSTLSPPNTGVAATARRSASASSSRCSIEGVVLATSTGTSSTGTGLTVGTTTRISASSIPSGCANGRNAGRMASATIEPSSGASARLKPKSSVWGVFMPSSGASGVPASVEALTIRPRRWHPRCTREEISATSRKEAAMKIRHVMVHNVVKIDSSASLAEAAQLMREANVGMLPVVDDSQVCGVITDRDLVVRAIAAGADLTATPVGECATGDPIVAHPDWDLDQAMEAMARAQVGRLPVIDDDNELAGIVTLGSLAQIGRASCRER